MAKKRRQAPRQGQPARAVQPATANWIGVDDPRAVLDDALARAAEVPGIEVEDLAPVTQAGADAPSEALAAALAARKLYERLIAETGKQEEALAELESGLTSQQASLSAREEAVDTKETEFTTRLEHLTKRANELEQREQALLAREADADASFLKRRHELMEPLHSQVQELTATWAQREKALLDEWDLRTRPLQAELDERAAEILARSRTLDERERAIKTKEEALQLDASRNEVQLTIMTETLAETDREHERLLAAERDRHSRELHDLRARLEGLTAKVEAADGLTRSLGEDPQAIQATIRRLQESERHLKRELEERPPADLADEVDQLRHRMAEAERDRDEARRGARDLEERMSDQRADLVRLEQVDRASETMEAVVAAYRHQVDELRAQFSQLTEQADRTSPFPACSAMDGDKRLQRSGPRDQVSSLKELVDHLQIAMSFEADQATGTTSLTYRREDVVTFMAGLAMSRLHLLEGVSGTGKTTLPRAFANALGGGVRMIEVQAGWRDKQDLIGYYNSFERVYRESDCLQYLYKAHLPMFEDRPIFIVLDEMNLSHPEHYFADFLSVIENPSASKLTLVDKELSDLPKHLDRDAGVQLKLPPNVWFIGTANQDETTFGFAPKTYDRAHVMNLRPSSDRLEPPSSVSKPPALQVSFASLQSAFRDAQRTHSDKAATAVDFVRGLEPFFDTEFRTRWGHRLDRQLRSFVAVHVACGGSVGEALDHMVATKVVSKIEGRRAVRPQQVRELAGRIEGSWPDRQHLAVRTLDQLETMARDLEGR